MYQSIGNHYRWVFLLGLIIGPTIAGFILFILGLAGDNGLQNFLFFSTGWVVFWVVVEGIMERRDPALDVTPDEKREQAFANMFELHDHLEK